MKILSQNEVNFETNDQLLSLQHKTYSQNNLSGAVLKPYPKWFEFDIRKQIEVIFFQLQLSNYMTTVMAQEK